MNARRLSLTLALSPAKVATDNVDAFIFLDIDGVLNRETLAVTPPTAGSEMAGESRGFEIRTWLMANAGDSSTFVVLDDAAPSSDLEAHWVRTNPSLGLSKTDVEAAVQILSSRDALTSG